MEEGRKHAFDLVRQILGSPIFLSQSTDQQQATLDEIVKTGEISRDDVFKLIQEQTNQQNQYAYLENLPYDVFVKIIDQGKIRGVDLLRLCSSSSKLREMCLKDRDFVDKRGQVYKSENQYVYRKLLAEVGLNNFPPTFNPAEYYRANGKSYYLSQYTLSRTPFVENSLEKLPPIDSNLFCTQVSTGNGYTLILDNLGNVWINFWAFSSENKTELKLLPFLQNIVQVDAADVSAAFLDADGNIWTINNKDLLGDDPIFTKLNISNQDVISKITKINHGFVTYFLDSDSHLYLWNHYPIGHVRSVGSDIKEFRINNYIKSSESFGADYSIPYDRTIYDNVTITNSNEIRTFPSDMENDPLNLMIPGITPKKVIPYNTKLVILSEDGNLYIFDKALELYPEMTTVNRIFSDMAQVKAENIVDIDVISNICIAIDSSGHVFIFNIKHPSEPQADKKLPYLVLKQIPGINNARKVSAGFYHIDILRDSLD